ncbi:MULTISPECIES: hypothetical protein [unclassified Streptomyces]|uniref:hypothetical protein n=1 Tax=unclassified Streptomyces TaxID=2593676 RepID=UPI002E160CBC|nr:hypothetical protein OIE76_37400 [Streptomyces sp. NBC_01727]
MSAKHPRGPLLQRRISVRGAVVGLLGRWGTNAPKTLECSFLPPQATCLYTSGLTRQMNPDRMATPATELALPALIAGIGFALACRLRGMERRAAQQGAVPAISGTADRRDTP